MGEILITEQFRADLARLDRAISSQVIKTVRQISADPAHGGLHTEKQITIRNRTILRSRVNLKYRILWEWLERGKIGLWRVGNHEFIDSFKSLPGVDGTTWQNFEVTPSAPPVPTAPEWRIDPSVPQPFLRCPENYLRLFGVPDDHLEHIRTLKDPEKIWEMPIPENVRFTLYDLWMRGLDWTADAFLDASQLLYRATVDQLAGYCEGHLKRLMLNLTDEQTELVYVSANGPLLIKGVAGSGKSTIGLYRLHYLVEWLNKFDPKASALLLTYSKTLAKALQNIYRELYGALSPRMKISDFETWLLKVLYPYWLPSAANPFASQALRIRLVQQAQREVATQHPEDRLVSRRPAQFLLDEIDDVIRARGIESLAAYQDIRRVGRGLGLDRERHRPLVWKIYERYQNLLDATNVVDRADLPRLILKRQDDLPKFDVIILDEVQDLPPICLRLTTMLMANPEESAILTLLTDPAQSIFYRGLSWKEAGLNLQGNRTRTLPKNFRNTRQILEAAQNILEGCVDLKREGEYIPPTSSNRLGPKPIVAQYDAVEHGLNFVVSTIIKLCQNEHYRLGDVAILARHDEFGALRTLLSTAALPFIHFDHRDFDIFENQIKLLTIHAAKGLEFPVVFMVDLDDAKFPLVASTDTEEDDVAQERKLFYVGMTRAAERLYLLHPKHNRSRFLHQLALDTITVIKLSGNGLLR